MGGIIGSILVHILPKPDQHCPIFTNATVVDDAIRFVSQKSKDKEKLKPSTDSNEDDKQESNEPDYKEDEEE